MARSLKVGIDYFSHDVTMTQDNKIRFIKAKYGLIGYAIYLRLLENIYSENGYYLKVDEKYSILFSSENNIDINVVNNVINDCINEELFNKNIFNKHKILTSKRIQANFLTACERRKQVEFIKEYLLIDPENIKNEKSKVNVIINEVNVIINDENVNKSTQKDKHKHKHKDKDIIVDADFEKFWNLYDKKSDREKCESKWNKISHTEKEAVFNVLDKYVISTPDKKFRKNPLTWLNGKCWNNEILIKNGGNDGKLKPKVTSGTDSVFG